MIPRTDPPFTEAETRRRLAEVMRILLEIAEDIRTRQQAAEPTTTEATDAAVG